MCRLNCQMTVSLFYLLIICFQPGKTSKKKPESLHMLSVWNKNYRIRPKFHLTETQNRPNLKGKEVVIKTKIHKAENITRPGTFICQKILCKKMELNQRTRFDNGQNMPQNQFENKSP